VLDPSGAARAVLVFVAKQIGVDPALFGEYARRAKPVARRARTSKLLRLRSFGLATGEPVFGSARIGMGHGSR
jgi:hypothetical protein